MKVFSKLFFVSARPFDNRHVTSRLLFLGGWTVVGVFFSIQGYVYSRLLNRHGGWKHAFLSNLPDWYLWAGLSLLIYWLARRFRFEKGRWKSSLAIHLPASFAVALAHLALAVTSLFVFVIDSSQGSQTWIRLFRFNFALTFHWNVMTYWSVLGLCYGLDFYHRFKDRELAAARLESRLAQAQLAALKMQLHPHFLFNTLHSISALLHKDLELADRMIARLGDFLRLTLDHSRRQEVTLQEELNFLTCYLEIERIRFGGRLTILYEVDPATREALVPNLLLQPIAENAIRHGISPRSEPGRIVIRSERAGALLRLQIIDDGPGLRSRPSGGGDISEGLGLANTRERLRQVYGNQYDFHLRDGPEKGLTVTIEIPFRLGNGTPDESSLAEVHEISRS
ncbi:MAG: histidine kinase [Acidobacteriota bacterium]